jgi:hypothetical protein
VPEPPATEELAARQPEVPGDDVLNELGDSMISQCLIARALSIQLPFGSWVNSPKDVCCPI